MAPQSLDLAIPGVNSPKFATFKVGVKSVKTQNRCNFHLELSHRGFQAAAVDGVRRPLPHLKKKKKKNSYNVLHIFLVRGRVNVCALLGFQSLRYLVPVYIATFW